MRANQSKAEGDEAWAFLQGKPGVQGWWSGGCWSGPVSEEEEDVVEVEEWEEQSKTRVLC